MNPLGSIALSGMRASQLRLDASAHNVANALTTGAARQTVVQQSEPGGGVSAALQPAADAASPSVDDALIADLVDQQVARYSFEANVLSLRAAHQMQGVLLDTFA